MNVASKRPFSYGLATLLGCGTAGVHSLNAQQEADLVLQNAATYTVDPNQPWATTIAIADGLLVYAGNDAGAQAYIGAGTTARNMQQRFVMPGIHDVHAPLPEAFHYAWTCLLLPGVSPESYIPALRLCRHFQLGSDWVLGAGYAIEDMALHIAVGGRPP